MNISKKNVLLLKAQDKENDKYEILLTENGFSVKHLEILDFKYINLQTLNTELANVDSYDGIIFTSPRAVHATKLSLNGTKLNKKWFDKHNFSVGDTTHNLVQKELDIPSRGEDTGNANNLVHLILEDHAKLNFKRFLFPCGNLKRESLGKQLKANQVDVNDITVYDTMENADIKKNFEIITSNSANIPEYIVYFSPSGVKYTTKIFKELEINLQELKLIAIGPSTEEALKLEELPCYAVAAKPNAKELLQALKH